MVARNTILIIAIFVSCWVLILTSSFHNHSINHSIDAIKNVPDIFFIGAGKSGTTSLYVLLNKHPQICRLPFKEPHYFDISERYSHGADWYVKTHFPGNCTRKLTYDATPRYIRTHEVPHRMKHSYSPENLRRKKLILLLREPIAREFSWYKHKLYFCSKHMAEVIKKRNFETKNVNGHVVQEYPQNPLCNELSGACGGEQTINVYQFQFT